MDIGDEEERVTVEPIEDPAHRDEPATPEREVSPDPEFVPANLLTSWRRGS